MHCEGEKTYDKPGDCPVCGMDLVEEAGLVSTAVQYTCPMHPEIIQDTPGACPICGMDLVPVSPAPSAETKNYQILLRKFIISLVFTLPIFLIAMSEMIPNNPLFRIMDQSRWNWVQFFLSLPVVFYTCWMFFERAWRSIITWRLNMFTLIGIGAGVAWLFSVSALLFPGFFPAQFTSHTGAVHVYFEAATVILTLVLLGQLLEARAHSQTNTAVKALLQLAPNSAIRVEHSIEVTVPIDQIEVGDLLRIKPGDKIPVDGRITEGSGAVDESMITGEPIPATKNIGDKLTAGTLNGNRSFLMKAEKVGSETLLAHIIQLVNEAGRSKAPIQKLADRISAWFVPVVVLISVLTFIAWTIWGPEPKYVYALVNAIAVLIIACPCALGLATPMSVMVGVGKGAQHGVLIRNATALQRMSEVDTVVVDKTGTLTEGKPKVIDLIPFLEDIPTRQLTQYLVSINAQSEHPLAAATVDFGAAQGIIPTPAQDFQAITGRGVEGRTEGKYILIGNDSLLLQNEITLPEEMAALANQHRQQGRTVSFIAVDGKPAGILIIGDEIKKTTASALKTLSDEGVNVIMLTGDNELTAQSVANELSLKNFKAGMLPQDKISVIRELQGSGHVVAMAGDGINDAPALAQSDVGIAMGTGTDIAIESSGITLLRGDLQGIAQAKALSHGVMKNIRQNLFFALIYNTVGVPVAAGILYPVFGILLSPMIAALAMSISSVSVIANALRLRNIRL